MKLAKILTDEADAIILRLKARPSNLDDVISRALTFTRSLSSDAYYAHLDGRTARAKALNKLADRVRIAALREGGKREAA